jgi:glycosyltransferase involved in cell wall biosynthesis
MKILFVSDVSIHHVIGGAERVLYEQAVGLARRGHEVAVLTRRLAEHDTAEELIQNVQEWRYPIDNRNALTFLHATLTGGTSLFERLQKAYAFELINGHQPFSAWAAQRSPLSRETPFVYTCHSLAFEEYETRHKKPKNPVGRCLYALNVALRRRIEGRVLARSKRIICLSEFSRQKLTTLHGIAPERIAIIPGGVDIDRFRPLADRMEARRRLGLPESAPLLFTVRNLVPRMGLENLIAAMPAITAALPHACLVIGGRGPLQESLAQQSRALGMEGHIRFAGFIPEEDLPAYFGTADCFVLPTVALEGFGLVTVEALACGTPALGTPVGGTVEILRGLGPGHLFQGTSPEAIAELTVRRCLDWQTNPMGYEDLAQRCRRYAEDRYAWHRNVEETDRLLGRLVHDG